MNDVRRSSAMYPSGRRNDSLQHRSAGGPAGTVVTTGNDANLPVAEIEHKREEARKRRLQSRQEERVTPAAPPPVFGPPIPMDDSDTISEQLSQLFGRCSDSMHLAYERSDSMYGIVINNSHQSNSSNARHNRSQLIHSQHHSAGTSEMISKNNAFKPANSGSQTSKASPHGSSHHHHHHRRQPSHGSTSSDKKSRNLTVDVSSVTVKDILAKVSLPTPLTAPPATPVFSATLTANNAKVVETAVPTGRDSNQLEDDLKLSDDDSDGEIETKGSPQSTGEQLSDSSSDDSDDDDDEEEEEEEEEEKVEEKEVKPVPVVFKVEPQEPEQDQSNLSFNLKKYRDMFKLEPLKSSPAANKPTTINEGIDQAFSHLIKTSQDKAEHKPKVHGDDSDLLKGITYVNGRLSILVSIDIQKHCLKVPPTLADLGVDFTKSTLPQGLRIPKKRPQTETNGKENGEPSRKHSKQSPERSRRKSQELSRAQRQSESRKHRSAKKREFDNAYNEHNVVPKRKISREDLDAPEHDDARNRKDFAAVLEEYSKQQASRAKKTSPSHLSHLSPAHPASNPPSNPPSMSPRPVSRPTPLDQVDEPYPDDAAPHCSPKSWATPLTHISQHRNVYEVSPHSSAMVKGEKHWFQEFKDLKNKANNITGDNLLRMSYYVQSVLSFLQVVRQKEHNNGSPEQLLMMLQEALRYTTNVEKTWYALSDPSSRQCTGCFKKLKIFLRLIIAALNHKLYLMHKADIHQDRKQLMADNLLPNHSDKTAPNGATSFAKSATKPPPPGSTTRPNQTEDISQPSPADSNSSDHSTASAGSQKAGTCTSTSLLMDTATMKSVQRYLQYTQYMWDASLYMEKVTNGIEECSGFFLALDQEVGRFSPSKSLGYILSYIHAGLRRLHEFCQGPSQTTSPSQQITGGTH